MQPTALTDKELDFVPSNIYGSIKYRSRVRTVPDSVAESLQEEIEQNSKRTVEELFEGGTLDCGDYALEYKLDARGNAVITECTTDVPFVRVPAEVEGHPVTVLGSHSFSRCYKLRRIELSCDLLEVGSYAFMNTALEAFDSPESLVAIREKAFYNCRKMRSITLPEGLLSIEASAFENAGIESLVVPSTVSFIGISVVSNAALDLAPGAERFQISSDNPYYFFQDGCLYQHMDDDASALIQCLWDAVEHYESIPGMTSVGPKAFCQCRKLKSVHLREGVEHLGDKVFFGCENLVELNFPNTLLSIGKNALRCTALTSLSIPASLQYAGTNAFCTLGEDYARKPQKIRSITVDPGNEHFYFETGLLCERREEEGDIALLHSTESTIVRVPDQVSSIGPFALAEAYTVEELSLHTGIAKMDICCFAVGRSIPRIIVRGVDTPSGSCLVQFPMTRRGALAIHEAFSDAPIDIERVYYYADRAICFNDDVFERSKAMVERLLGGQYLVSAIQSMFVDRLTNCLKQTVIEFGKHGYLAGIRSLADLGIISEKNIESVQEAVVAADEIAASSCLMEIRRTKFGAPMFDFDL